MEIAVIDEPEAACSALDPVRSRLLAALAEPGSASTVAKRVGLTRQKANYHLRDLEEHGLVELVEERRRGNMVERVLRASAPSFVISPAALAELAPDPSRSPDQLSARWLLALAARLLREVGELVRGAHKAGKPLATFAIDGEVRFAGAADRAAFADELGTAVRELVARYHDEGAPGGRKHRIVVALHPSLNPAPSEPSPSAATLEE
ncbi:ArsR/SmtB family transcription factor [Actinospica robiniae]|uniref:ArsR/SmtB family transcription factor n=1 Tax=Actinospica robiniae TaxID=304901 RepID=UPI0004106A27|nr:helix-turn-helix domain-containing protein [Actinospica robiniae]